MTAVNEDGNNVCFPAVERLESNLANLSYRAHPPAGAWRFPAGPNKLSTLLGNPCHVRSVQFSTSDLSVVSECLSLLPTKCIDELGLEFGYHVRVLPETYPPLSSPAVSLLSFGGDDEIELSKDQASSVMSAVTHVRPSKAHLSLQFDTSGFQLR